MVSIYYTFLFNKYYYTYLFSQKFGCMSRCDILKTFQHHVENYVEKMLKLLKTKIKQNCLTKHKSIIYYTKQKSIIKIQL